MSSLVLQSTTAVDLREDQSVMLQNDAQCLCASCRFRGMQDDLFRINANRIRIYRVFLVA